MIRWIPMTAVASAISLVTAVTALVVAGFSAAARAQAPPPAPLQTPNPTYTTIEMEVQVNRPAAELWKRVGKYCDIGEWFQIPCKITSGKDGELGTVRSISIASEIMVGKTDLWYTYTMPVREGVRYNLYHGTFAVRPVTASTSKVVWTLLFDNSHLPDEAAKQADRDRRRTQFMAALQNMKTLAEGGTLPPPSGPEPAVRPSSPRR